MRERHWTPGRVAATVARRQRDRAARGRNACGDDARRSTSFHGGAHDPKIASSRACHRAPGCAAGRRGRDGRLRAAGQEAQCPDHLGRRHRPVQHQCLQPGHDGLQDAEHRSHRERGGAVHRLVWPTELHRRSRGLHYRAVPDPYRSHEGRPPRRARGHEEGRPDHCDAAQGAGLRDRPVRQESPGRHRRHAADQARFRRVLRQPLPPERGGGTGERRLPEEPGIQEAVRAARRHPQLRRWARHGHGSAHQEADGDDRRGGQRQGARFHRARQ